MTNNKKFSNRTAILELVCLLVFLVNSIANANPVGPMSGELLGNKCGGSAQYTVSRDCGSCAAYKFCTPETKDQDGKPVGTCTTTRDNGNGCIISISVTWQSNFDHGVPRGTFKCNNSDVVYKMASIDTILNTCCTNCGGTPPPPPPPPPQDCRGKKICRYAQSGCCDLSEICMNSGCCKESNACGSSCCADGQQCVNSQCKGAPPPPPKDPCQVCTVDENGMSVCRIDCSADRSCCTKHKAFCSKDPACVPISTPTSTPPPPTGVCPMPNQDPERKVPCRGNGTLMCCYEQQECKNGLCVSKPCPDGRYACNGSKCCQPNEKCENSQCVEMCKGMEYCPTSGGIVRCCNKLTQKCDGKGNCNPISRGPNTCSGSNCPYTPTTF